MHTITVSIQGNVNVSESIEVDDREALPLFINLKAILQSGETPKPLRRGRPRKEKRLADDALSVPLSEDAEAAGPAEA